MGVSYSAKLSVDGESAVSITKVTGLPKGLAYKSGKVTGVPTVAEFDAEGVLRTAKGTMKYGKKTCKVEIAVAEGESGGGEAEVAVMGAVTASGVLSLP